MEVLQVDEESVREEMTTILEGETDLIPNKYEGGFKVWEGKPVTVIFIDVIFSCFSFPPTLQDFLT